MVVSGRLRITVVTRMLRMAVPGVRRLMLAEMTGNTATYPSVEEAQTPATQNGMWLLVVGMWKLALLVISPSLRMVASTMAARRERVVAGTGCTPITGVQPQRTTDQGEHGPNVPSLERQQQVEMQTARRVASPSMRTVGCTLVAHR